MQISLRRRHALTVADGDFSHKIDYVTIVKEILNPEGHPNRITGAKVTAILLNGWTLPIGGASSVRLCSCSLRSRLVFCGLEYVLGENEEIQRGKVLWECIGNYEKLK